MKIIIFLIFIGFIFLSKNSYAYLDPGTVTIFFQVIVGALAAGGAYIVLFWQKIKNFFNKKKRNK